jgi:hypothetical protein
VGQNAIGYTGPYNQLSPAWQQCVRPRRHDDAAGHGALDQRYTTAHLSTPAERHSLFLKGNYEINE